MKSMITLLIATIAVFPGCGSSSKAAPESDGTGSPSVSASIEDSALATRVADTSPIHQSNSEKSMHLPDPIILEQAEEGESPEGVTITNEGEKPASSATTPPTFGEGNLWVSGQANDLKSPEGKETESGFQWVTPSEESAQDNANSGTGFQWSNDEKTQAPKDNSKGALEQTEVERRAAEAKAMSEVEARQEALKALADEQIKAQKAIEAAQLKANEDVSAVRTELEKQLAALRAEQARILAEVVAANKLAEERAVANEQSREELMALREKTDKEKKTASSATEEARAFAEENAKARAQAEEELARLKEQTEKEKVVAAVARQEAQKLKEGIERAKTKAEEELARYKEQIEQEKIANAKATDTARMKAAENARAQQKAESQLAAEKKERLKIKADADQARMRAESEAKAKAQMEAALLRAKEGQAKAERAALESKVKPVAAPTPESPKPVAPAGTIQLAKLEQDAILKGVYGIKLGSLAEIENLSGSKIELAAYFFDTEGNPLKDKDKNYRSSKGQVYVGKESVVPSDFFELKDDLFLPFKQLDSASKEALDLQVELVLWEYSGGRGKRLSVSPRVKFTHNPLPDSERINIKQRQEISGTWQHGESLVTIVQQGDQVVINGLGIVPYKILSERWMFEDGILRGSIINKRKLPPLTRVWEFNLQIAQDGKSLTGTFHRADKNGNFAFDSAPFTWARTSQ